MKFAVVGDVHGNDARLEVVVSALAVEKPELALLVGDLGTDPPWSEPARSRDRERHDDSIRRVIRRVEAGLSCPAVFVPGNHDLPKPPREFEDRNADGKIVRAAGLAIAGFGGAGPQFFGFPYEWSEETAESRLAAFLSEAGPIDVFLCHTPPVDTSLDRLAHGGDHVGSRAVATWLERVGPRLFACGHIHEAGGVERCHGEICMNAGALGEPYGRAVGWIVTWDSGPVAIESIELGRRGEERISWPLGEDAARR